MKSRKTEERKGGREERQEGRWRGREDRGKEDKRRARKRREGEEVKGGGTLIKTRKEE